MNRSIAAARSDGDVGEMLYVITAVYNARHTLRAALESVAMQTYSNVRHIVVDGGSVDGSVDILRQYSPHLYYWESGPDQGVYDAWNKALKMIGPGWVMFLGADDRLADPDVLRRVGDRLNGIDASICYGRVIRVDSSGAVLGREGYFGGSAVRSWKGVRPWTPPHPATLYRARIFETLRFDESYVISADAKLTLQAQSAFGGAVGIDEDIVAMSVGGMSGTRHMQVFRENLRISEELGCPLSRIRIGFSLGGAVMKSLAQRLLGMVLYSKMLNSLRRLKYAM